MKSTRALHHEQNRRPAWVRPEALESRSLLSAAIDLSLQGAIWAGSEVISPQPSATIAPFRIDAIRLPTNVAPITGLIDCPPGSPARIDGLPPGGALTGTAITGGSDVLTFTQVQGGGMSSVFSTLPFERDPSAFGVDSQPVVAVSGKPFEKPDGEIDWSGFEIFKDVAFTFVGGQIQAGLPIDGQTVSVRIVIAGLPQGAEPPKDIRTGVGNFYARLGAFGTIVSPPPGSGNGVLVIPPEPSGGSTDVPPGGSTANPPASNPGGVTQPSNDRGDKPGTVDRPDRADAPDVDHQVQFHSTASDTLAIGERPSYATLESGRGLQFITVPRVSSTGATLGDPTRPTTLLETPVESDARLAEIARYAVFTAGTQLASFGEAALRLFGTGDMNPNAGPIIVDLDALRKTAVNVYKELELSPWHVANAPAQSVATAWRITAGVSLVVAVGGYWYCKEYTARRRQEMLAASRLSSGRPGDAAEVPASRPGRHFIGRISRIFRDEVAY